MTRFVFVGNYGGALQLNRAADELEANNHTVYRQLAVNADVSEESVVSIVNGSDIVVVGCAPSEKTAAPELYALKHAIDMGKKIVLVADTFGAFSRPWIESFRSAIDHVVVVAECDVESAEEMFPNASVHVVPNSNWWAKRTPNLSRTEACGKLGIPEEDFIILYGGTKQELADSFVLGSLANACLCSNGNRRTHIVYTIHPGTPVFGENKMDEDMLREAMRRLFRVPQNISNNVQVRVAPKEISTDDVQCAADVVTECMSETGTVAAILQQPVITFFPPMLKKHLKFLKGTSPSYPLLEVGASALAPEGSRDLYEIIMQLYRGGELRDHQLTAQREFIVMDQNPAIAMADFLESL